MFGGLVWGLALWGCSSDLVIGKGNGGEFNNYKYTGELTVDDIEVAPGADLTIDWSAMTTDIRGRDLEPETVELVSIARFDGPFGDILPKIERNEIGQSDALEIYLFENVDGLDVAQLSEFAIQGMSMDPALLQEDPSSTWFLSLVNQPDDRNDVLSSVHLVPTNGETETLVAFTDASARLDVEVDLQSADTLQAKAGKPLDFKWQAADKDAFGRPFDDQLGDELIIAHYDMDLAGVEAEFLQLDTIGVAKELYRLNVFGRRAAVLADARDDSGQAFGGFTEDGTWLVGITCSTCMAPIPMLLTPIEVR